MKCANCEFENSEGAKFCLECGSEFRIKCPSCGKELPQSAKFCDECGTKLAESKTRIETASLEDKIDKIQRYLPKGLTEKILAQKDRIEGERKQVTVMFCDMVGFTSFSERLEP